MLGIVSCPHIAGGDYTKFHQRFNDEFEHRNRIHLECYVCERSNQHLWMCLHSDCLKVFCSDVPPNHTLSHFKRESTHCLHMSLSNFRIWCHQCNAEIEISTEEKETTPKGLVGLQNLGNTCYMNAALQSLANTPPLVDFFLNLSLVSTPRPQVTRAFHKLIVDIWSRLDGYIAPHGLLYAMRHTHPMYRGFQQHDSQEFLRCLLDQIHEEIKVPSLEPLRHESYSFDRDDLSDFENASSEAEDYETCDSGVSEQSSQSDEASGKMSISPSPSPVMMEKLPWKSQLHHNTIGTPSKPKKQLTYRSIVSDVFNGTLLSSVQCLTCNRVSSRIETFQDLSLPIPNRDTIYILHQSAIPSSGTPAKCAHLHSSDQDSGILMEPTESDNLNSLESGEAKISIPPDFGIIEVPEIRGGAENNSQSVEDLYKKNRDYLKGWLSWLWDCVCYWIWGPQVSLHDCLSAFFSADELKGDNMYSCDKCQKLRNGVKYSRLLSCPEVLCIHLKRFRHEPSLPSKISSHVSFPLEGLDLAQYIAPDCKSGVSKYDLVSVICHHGHGGSSGHYTCLAKSRSTGEWYEFDDISVTPLSSSVTSARAYILFYRKDCTKINRARKRASRLEEISTSEKDRYYVSKDWLIKFNSFAEPGPVDNRLLICQHGVLLPGAETVVVSRTVWKYLITRFGGGPECSAERLSVCDVCSEISGGDSDLLRVQLHEFHRLQSHGLHEMHQISISWLTSWENYVKGRSNTSPGPVSSSGNTCEISGGRWELLTSLYGVLQPVQNNSSIHAESSESDSRSLDERISLDNLDSGIWVHNLPDRESESCSLDLKSS